LIDDTVKVTVIGTGDGGLKPGMAVTAGAAPNVLIGVIQPVTAIVIRGINTYLTTLVGLVAAGMTSDIIPYTDFLALVMTCAKLSVAGAALGALKDCVTIFGRLESKFPLLTGNV